jgi:ligand-binding sensor domain-containing protein
MDDVVYNHGKLIVGSDFGVFVSSDNGATWSHLGTNLPNVVIGQLTIDPNGVLVAATHGRGIWTIAAP